MFIGGFKFLFLSLCLCASAAFSAEQSGGRPPNIILILADDLGWADLGCYGADLHESPALDKLAAQGIRFTDAYAAASVCTPTRAALMTGKHPARLGMTIWRESAVSPQKGGKLIPPPAAADLPLDQVSIAAALKAKGYATAHVGKWHLGDPEHFPEAHGFDVNIGGSIWGAPDSFFHPYKNARTFKDHRYIPGLGLGKPGDCLTDKLTDEALKLIEQMKHRPFFLNLWHYSVHTPIEARPEEIAHFQAKLKPGMHHQHPVYAAMVRNLDENVARVLAKLDELNLADNTYVIFASDNGGYINGDHGNPMPVTNNFPLRSGKGSLYEGGIRDPLIIRGPSIAPGSVSRVPVNLLDLYPTMLQWAGYNPADQPNGPLDGVALQPVLAAPAAALDRPAMYWHYPHYYNTTTPVSSIRDGNFTLLEYHEDHHVEMYDLSADLSQKNDLSKTNPQKAAELTGRLHAWYAATGARMPTVNPNPPAPKAGKKKNDRKANQ